MVPGQSHNAGLRFTLRHFIILSVYGAVLFKVIIPLVRYAGYHRIGPVVIAGLLFTPPLLALLVAFIERPGPLKNWAISLLLCLYFPVLVLNHDIVVVRAYLASGTHPSVWATFLINAVILTGTLPYLGRMVPRPCPTCRRRTLVPLLRLSKTDKRTAKTCWCASCGAKFWKDREGNWRVERRTTWVDEPREPSRPATGAPLGGRGLAPGDTQECSAEFVNGRLSDRSIAGLRNRQVAAHRWEDHYES
jgi:hypothetical protein